MPGFEFSVTLPVLHWTSPDDIVMPVRHSVGPFVVVLRADLFLKYPGQWRILLEPAETDVMFTSCSPVSLLYLAFSVLPYRVDGFDASFAVDDFLHGSW